MWSWLGFRSGEQSLRAVTVPDGSPYRQPEHRNLERTPESVPLPRLREALDAAHVPHRARRNGFDLLGADRRVMAVRVRDPARVVPSELRCGTDAPELLLDLALALVPVFGPLIAELRYAGSILVDGRRDRRELGEDAARAIQQFGRRIAAHAPIAFPILVDLARRIRTPRN